MAEDPLFVLRQHAKLPDSMLWAELGVKVPAARVIVKHINVLTERLSRAEAELHDHETLQRMQWDRMTEATALWRAEDPEARALTMPDLGALLQWLMARGAQAAESDPEQCSAGVDRG